MLERAVSLGDASKRHLAFLIDRILVNEGMPQMFGTQVLIVEGMAMPYEVKDSTNLDRRRREMNLDSFDEYLASIKKVYQLQN